MTNSRTRKKSDPTLSEEARYFHASLFHRPADDTTIARYTAAHRHLFPDDSPSHLVTQIVTRRLDAEAIEFALRRRGRGPELTRKLQIVCYLVEVRSTYLTEFVNLHASRVRAWTTLTGATLGAIWKLCKGEYTIRRHGLL
jgi:hypothetical protein